MGFGTVIQYDSLDVDGYLSSCRPTTGIWIRLPRLSLSTSFSALAGSNGYDLAEWTSLPRHARNVTHGKKLHRIAFDDDNWCWGTNRSIGHLGRRD